MPFNSKSARLAGAKSRAVRKGKKPALTEGLNVAAGLIGVAVEVLQKAKRAGCPGFMPGNRINVPVVEEWLLLNGDTIDEGQSLNGLRRRSLTAKIQAERIWFDSLTGEHGSTAGIAEAARRVARANQEVSQRLLPASLCTTYCQGVTDSLTRLARKMARKTRHTAPVDIIPLEPKETDSLDDLRAILLAWKTRNLEAQNALANGELIEVAKAHDMIATNLAQPVSMARKHMLAEPWNEFCRALKEEIDRALSLPFHPTPKEITL
jgi:hypothetical protein